MGQKEHEKVSNLYFNYTVTQILCYKVKYKNNKNYHITDLDKSTTFVVHLIS